MKKETSTFEESFLQLGQCSHGSQGDSNMAKVYGKDFVADGQACVKCSCQLVS